MSPTIGLPPPEPESCLVTSRVSRFKGGTIVDEDVRDLDAHMRRIRSPDGYRPPACLDAATTACTRMAIASVGPEGMPACRPSSMSHSRAGHPSHVIRGDVGASWDGAAR